MAGIGTWGSAEDMKKWAQFSAEGKGLFEHQNPHLCKLLVPVIERLRVEVGSRSIRILDLGCGDGRVLKLLPESSGPYEYTGVDMSDLLQIARQDSNTLDGSSYTFRDCDAIDYVSSQGGTQSFDLILLIQFLHYTDEGKVPEFVRSLYSILSKNGFLFYYMNDRYYYETPLVETIKKLPFIYCKAYLQWVIAKKMGE